MSDRWEAELRRVPELSYGFRTRLRFVVSCAIQAGLPLDATTEVLDVGCGTGELLAVPLARMGYRLTGVDPHEPSLARARSLARGLAADFSSATPEALLAAGRRFHLTICSEVLEHLADPRPLLDAVRELTRPEGLCIVTVPSGRGAFEMSVKLQRRLRGPASGSAPGLPGDGREPGPRDTLNTDSPHVQFFAWASIQELLRAARFRIERARGRTLLCGPGLDPLVDRFGAVAAANAGLAGLLPARLAADWMFCLRPEPSGARG